MNITATFDSYEEMLEFAKKIAAQDASERPVEAPVKKEVETPAPEPKKATAKTEAKQEEGKWEPIGNTDLPFGNDAVPKEETKKPEITETKIKTIFAEKLKEGKKKQVKELFGKYGVEKLSELIEQHPEKLAEVYALAEAL